MAPPAISKKRPTISNALNDVGDSQDSDDSNSIFVDYNATIATTSREDFNTEKNKNFRAQAVNEIVTSEESYLSQLDLLMNYFVQPLLETSIIDDITHTSLFGQIQIIFNLNSELLLEITTDPENLSKAFVKIAPFLKLYSVYAFDYRHGLFVLEDLKANNEEFKKFLERTESRPEVQKTLNSLMIAPIQRIPRYKLLLEQVLLYTSPDDPTYNSLKDSIKEVEKTATHINSCVEEQDMTERLVNLQNSLLNRLPNIVKPSRRILIEGILMGVTHKKDVKRYCVLMSDIFMFCKILKERRSNNSSLENSLNCCCIFPLKKCKVAELFPCTFKITCQGDGAIFSTSDVELRLRWVECLRTAIQDLIQCRQTLRKESSKRTPLRKRDVKKFGSDYVLSTNGTNNSNVEYESVYRNCNADSSDDNDDPDSSNATSSSWNCLQQPTDRANKKKNMALKRRITHDFDNESDGFIEEGRPRRGSFTSMVGTSIFRSRNTEITSAHDLPSRYTRPFSAKCNPRKLTRNMQSDERKYTAGHVMPPHSKRAKLQTHEHDHDRTRINNNADRLIGYNFQEATMNPQQLTLLQRISSFFSVLFKSG